MCLGAVYLVLGVVQLVAHTGDSARSLLFWGVTLLGGGAVVLAGVYVAHRSSDAGRAMVTVGAVLGMVSTVWTVVVPVLAVAVVVYAVREPRQLAH